MPSVVSSDSSPQPRENSLERRDIQAINKSSGWDATAEPTIPTERLAVSCCTEVDRFRPLSYARKAERAEGNPVAINTCLGAVLRSHPAPGADAAALGFLGETLAQLL